jgi:transposase
MCGRRDVFVHQVTEVEDRGVWVTEYSVHRSHCARCHRFTRARLPEGVTRHAFGPKLTGLIATRTVTVRLSKRNVQALLLELFGVSISRGAMTGCERRVSAALQEAVAEATAHVQAAAVAHADETPWKNQHQLRWLWVAGTRRVWVFQIHADRKKIRAQALLGHAFDGTLVADDYGGYRYVRKRQQCWSHRLRRFKKLQTCIRDSVAVAVGDEGARLIAKMLALYRRHTAGQVDLATFRRGMKRHPKRMRLLLAYGAASASSWTQSRCKAIAKMGAALWAFVDDPARIEPTNNASERALRHAVLLRRTSLGTQSEAGQIVVARMLTVTQTLRRQARCVLAFVQRTMHAWTRGEAGPSLLPQPN